MEKRELHVAIIMDGNGRWAKKRKKARTFGHFAGSENIRNITIKANDLNIAALSLYAFSTENWKRPIEEVDYLMKLPQLFFDKYLKELLDNNVRITTIGDYSPFPLATKKYIDDAKAASKSNSGLILNFALNYGSVDEITKVVQRIVGLSQNNKDLVIDQNLVEENLETAFLPPLDLLIRTGGEQRLSNFLLYQAAYSELFFVKEAWPDFSTALFEQCLQDFTGRSRRFGGL